MVVTDQPALGMHFVEDVIVELVAFQIADHVLDVDLGHVALLADVLAGIFGPDSSQ